MKTSWKVIIRDAAIVFVLTFLGGFIVGVSATNEENGALGLILSNIIFSIMGFCISGALAKVNRFKHLIKVALLVWLLSTINLLVGVSFTSWLISIVAVFIFMGLGGLLSFIFVRAPKPSQQAD